MTRLGLRLMLRSGRESLLRFGVTVFAVAAGVLLLLTTVGATNAVGKQNERVAWAYSSEHNVRPSVDEKTTDPLLWYIDVDTFKGGVIARVDVAATGRRSPVPPGIPRLPGAGEIYASPAMVQLMRDNPAPQLAERFPGRIVGTVDPAVLPGSDTALVIVGRDAAALRARGDVTTLRSFETSPAVSGQGVNGGPAGFNSGRVDFVLYVVVISLMLPILVFIAAATRLGAARREERFAAMRLVGATPGQIARLSAVESLGAGIVGSVVGALAFFAAHPLLVQLSFLRSFHASDVEVSALQLAAVAVVVPVLAVAVSAAALRRVRISPLGVVRRATPKAPSIMRLLPLVAGVVELVVVLLVGPPKTTAGQERVFAPGFLLILIGIVTAGPWFTMATARLAARRSRSVTSLLAVRRLADNPRVAFRAVSGLVLAVYTSTVAFAVLNTVLDSHVSQSRQSDAGSTVFITDFNDDAGLAPAPTVSQLRAIDGVTGTAVIHRVPRAATESFADRVDDPAAVSCAQLVTVPAVGRCASGVSVAEIDFDPGGAIVGPVGQAGMLWPTAKVTADQLARLPVETVLVTTDGNSGVIEQVRTRLEVLYPNAWTPGTIGGWPVAQAQLMEQYQQLAYAIIVSGLVVAGCTLAVASVAGIVERKRPFSLLRLTGVALADLRRVVLLESLLPLVSAVAGSVALALISANLFVRAQLKMSLQPPTAGYFVALLLGVVASLAIISATLPLLSRVTGPETARNE